MSEVKNLEVLAKPSYPGDDARYLCQSLILEESTEVFEVLNLLTVEPNSVTYLADLAKELADLVYVTLYAANAFGIDMEPIFEEVQRSNMTKKGGEKRFDGKMLKGPNYEPPNIRLLIQQQIEHHC